MTVDGFLHPEADKGKERKRGIAVEQDDFALYFVIRPGGNYIIRFNDTARFPFAGILVSGMFVVDGIILFATFRHKAKAAFMMMMRNTCERQQQPRSHKNNRYGKSTFQS
jgi:hypothetical protein